MDADHDPGHPAALPDRLRCCTALLAFVLSLAVAAPGPAGIVLAADPLPTVGSVDLCRFAGTWHEVARLPNAFQAGCVGSRACYTVRGDGTIGVRNTCTKRRGRQVAIEGTAEPVPGSGNARLRVRFEGLAGLVPVSREGNYWIIALDDDYQWAMVGTPDRRFLWILSRRPCLDSAIDAELRRRACRLGFDTERLVR